MVASQYGRWARSRYSGEAGAASPVCCLTCSKTGAASPVCCLTCPGGTRPQPASVPSMLQLCPGRRPAARPQGAAEGPSGHPGMRRSTLYARMISRPITDLECRGVRAQCTTECPVARAASAQGRAHVNPVRVTSCVFSGELTLLEARRAGSAGRRGGKERPGAQPPVAGRRPQRLRQW